MKEGCIWYKKMTINIWGRGFNQFLEEDWKMKTAVRTPTNAVTAKATVGNGLATPKFWTKQTNNKTYQNKTRGIITFALWLTNKSFIFFLNSEERSFDVESYLKKSFASGDLNRNGDSKTNHSATTKPYVQTAASFCTLLASHGNWCSSSVSTSSSSTRRPQVQWHWNRDRNTKNSKSKKIKFLSFHFELI